MLTHAVPDPARDRPIPQTRHEPVPRLQRQRVPHPAGDGRQQRPRLLHADRQLPGRHADPGRCRSRRRQPGQAVQQRQLARAHPKPLQRHLPETAAGQASDADGPSPPRRPAAPPPQPPAGACGASDASSPPRTCATARPGCSPPSPPPSPDASRRASHRCSPNAGTPRPAGVNAWPPSRALSHVATTASAGEAAAPASSTPACRAAGTIA